MLQHQIPRILVYSNIVIKSIVFKAKAVNANILYGIFTINVFFFCFLFYLSFTVRQYYFIHFEPNQS